MRCTKRSYTPRRTGATKDKGSRMPPVLSCGDVGGGDEDKGAQRRREREAASACLARRRTLRADLARMIGLFTVRTRFGE